MGFEIGWFMTIIVGGIAGWLAGKLMDMRFGVLMNIVIGIVGAAVAAAIFRRLGIFVEGDTLGYLITSFVGASLLLFIAKLVRR
ncbi:MAG: GlsB/YeaQ/YmgE family stress response membrane protein [Rhizobium sp.]|nr:GlsB/YeaQ/YmgE family stress response membrane protein [Rhizobium sp.]